MTAAAEVRVGFTGVLWDARPTRALADDLRDGPGATPLSEADAAWRALGSDLSAVGDELDSVVSDLERTWRSGASSAVVNRAVSLRRWIDELGTHATDSAERARRQVDVTEVAMSTMPSAEDVASTDADKARVDSVGRGVVVTPLTGGGTRMTEFAHAQRLAAARAMHSYEHASTDTAVVWSGPARPQMSPLAASPTHRTARPVPTPTPTTTSLHPALPEGVLNLGPPPPEGDR